jgi:hypothetical protein
MDARSVLKVLVPSGLLAATAVCALTEWRASHQSTGGALVTPAQAAIMFDAPDDITFKKVKGKFKYKGDSPANAQQKWVVAGEVPTTHTSFDDVSTVGHDSQMDGGDTHAGAARPLDTTGILGRKHDRYREKFFYYGTRSTDHAYPSYGRLKMKLKDGMLSYMYVISKANEGDCMVGLNKYADVKAATATGKVTRTISATTSFNIGDEMHAGTRTVEANGKSKAAKFRLGN